MLTSYYIKLKNFKQKRERERENIDHRSIPFNCDCNNSATYKASFLETLFVYLCRGKKLFPHCSHPMNRLIVQMIPIRF